MLLQFIIIWAHKIICANNTHLVSSKMGILIYDDDCCCLIFNYIATILR
jgi:hypothetical protein